MVWGSREPNQLWPVPRDFLPEKVKSVVKQIHFRSSSTLIHSQFNSIFQAASLISALAKWISAIFPL
jgi:hypothetical protein